MSIIVTCLLSDYNQKNVFLGLHHEINENRAFLGYYTASSGNFLPFQDNLSLRNYLSSLLNNREEHSSQKNVLTNFSTSIHLSVPELYVVRQTGMVKLIEAFYGF
jgi:NRPS condensation-like uncharacterized protein